MLVTAILNVSKVEALEPSVAVTFTVIVPTSPFFGVPLKVRVPALKESQEGRLDPFERAAVYVRLSPLSISVNVLEALKLRVLSSIVLLFISFALIYCCH